MLRKETKAVVQDRHGDRAGNHLYVEEGGHNRQDMTDLETELGTISMSRNETKTPVQDIPR